MRAAVETHIKLCIRWLEGVDHNKDGYLSVDGFVAALLHPELKVSKEEIIEAFYLSANRANLLAY